MATTKITNPDLFDLGSLNTALQLPSGTTAERPASPSTGEWRYNTTTYLVEFWDGGAWRDLQSEDIPPVPSEHFNTVLYNGTSATQSITGVGFQPDFVWIKRRDGTENHYWQDSSRGSTQQIYSNLTNAQFNETTAVTSFDSDGFTMGSYNGINNSGETYVAWCWKLNGGTTSTNTDGSITSTVQVNTKVGISIVQYTGTQANATVGHGLGVAPSLVITKALGAANGWPTLVQADSTTRYDGLRLNEAGLNNSGNGAGFFQNTSPTDSVFSLGNSDESNRNATATIAYCFAEVAGFSSIGGYSGNGSDNGPIINTGFEPAWLMIKVVTGSADGWFMVDNKRDTSNPRAVRVFANSDVGDAEEPGAQVDFFTNGFQLRGSGGGQGQTNKSGSTYVYIAFASDPSAAPVLADSFSQTTYSGTDTTNNLYSGFAPSFFWNKVRNDARTHNVFDTVRGAGELLTTNNTNAESTVAVMNSFNSDGVTISGSDAYMNSSSFDYVAYFWKAAELPAINNDGTFTTFVSANQAAGFSIVKFSTTSPSASDVFPHGLGAAPDAIIAKTLSAATPWNIYHTSVGTGKYLEFTTSSPQTNSNYFATVDATTFQYRPSSTNQTYIALCFKSIAGFSKIGSYVGNGSAGQTITLGFELSWILIKSTVGTANWVLYDTARGILNGYFEPNNTDAERTTNAPNMTITSTGFEITSGGVTEGLNSNGNEYIYFAFKENPTPQPAAGNMSFLIVGGGAAGGSGNGGSGGGGAGGLRTSYGNTSGGGTAALSDITLAAGTYTITVGGGGAGVGNVANTVGNDGSDSELSGPSMTTINCDGGGGGGAWQGQDGRTGGSGGGGGAKAAGTGNTSGGAGSAGQGFAGGTGWDGTTPYAGGGGGGASQAGENGGNNSVANGGDGLAVSITGTSVAYAGGGGSGTEVSTYLAEGQGGTGGGGTGGTNTRLATAGTANTGGGGGGGGYPSGFYDNGAGGSGVVVLRLLTSEYSGTTTGSPTVTTDGTYTILTYTGSGTYVHS